ncbi:contact-dependent growth inhibition system immunity protein [Spongiimicrobium sp. 2-473A-2-J]|uniref:contact-dependent growth inhibition system immunity protein n=1 Tax=Eudoraea algarum TaxID=3417568 RepID=UPI003D36CF5D
MKFENNWKHKTLEALERSYWEVPTFKSHLVQTCHALRKKQLKDFDVEDLRLMIGQNEGLDYLIPLAIAELGRDILSEGNLFEGDLLLNVLKSDEVYWKRETENLKIVCALFDQNKQRILNFAPVGSIRKSLFEAFDRFKELNDAP